jgi:rubrerythrin
LETQTLSSDVSLSVQQQSVWSDIFAQAITGELVGALNYGTLAEICDDETERADASEHAERETLHAQVFRTLCESLGIRVTADVNAPYWARIRAAFVRSAEMRDRIACFVIQEVMLESFAVGSYDRIARVAPPAIAKTFAAIAAEEGQHVGHAMELLRGARSADPYTFDSMVNRLHNDVMSTLAEMVAKDDPAGHCGLCSGTCVKEALQLVGLCTSDLRGASLRKYMQTLDAIGVPGDVTLQWVARLPV